MRLNGLISRVEAAVEKDPSIMKPKMALQTHEGYSLEYMESLGLKKKDLKSLEAFGGAYRGYRKVKRGNAAMTEVRWILVED